MRARAHEWHSLQRATAPTPLAASLRFTGFLSYGLRRCNTPIYMQTKHVVRVCGSLVVVGALSVLTSCAVEADADQDADDTSEVSAAATTQSSVTCNVVLTGCTSGAISANASGHWITWGVNSGDSGNGCSFRVRDIDTNVVVGSGRVGAFSFKTDTIFGLVGRYRIELFSCLPGGQGGLRNI